MPLCVRWWAWDESNRGGGVGGAPPPRSGCARGFYPTSSHSATQMSSRRPTKLERWTIVRQQADRLQGFSAWAAVGGRDASYARPGADRSPARRIADIRCSAYACSALPPPDVEGVCDGGPPHMRTAFLTTSLRRPGARPRGLRQRDRARAATPIRPRSCPRPSRCTSRPRSARRASSARSVLAAAGKIMRTRRSRREDPRARRRRLRGRRPHVGARLRAVGRRARGRVGDRPLRRGAEGRRASSPCATRTRPRRRCPSSRTTASARSYEGAEYILDDERQRGRARRRLHGRRRAARASRRSSTRATATSWPTSERYNGRRRRARRRSARPLLPRHAGAHRRRGRGRSRDAPRSSSRSGLPPIDKLGPMAGSLSADGEGVRLDQIAHRRPRRAAAPARHALRGRRVGSAARHARRRVGARWRCPRRARARASWSTPSAA